MCGATAAARHSEFYAALKSTIYGGWANDTSDSQAPAAQDLSQYHITAERQAKQVLRIEVKFISQY